MHSTQNRGLSISLVSLSKDLRSPEFASQAFVVSCLLRTDLMKVPLRGLEALNASSIWTRATSEKTARISRISRSCPIIETFRHALQYCSQPNLSLKRQVGKIEDNASITLFGACTTGAVPDRYQLLTSSGSPAALLPGHASRSPRQTFLGTLGRFWLRGSLLVREVCLEYHQISAQVRGRPHLYGR